MTKPKILLLDIENSHNIGAFFQLRDDNGIPHTNLLKERAMFCASWKWLGESKTYSSEVKPSPSLNDKSICSDLTKAINQSDGMIAHYGCGHDFPFINTRVIYHKLKPVAPIIEIDTWKIARSAFKFNSNRLDYLGQFLGCGNKVHTSAGLWLRCLDGDKGALKEMVHYNRADVDLLEKVYIRLAPFVPAKINANLFSDRPGCPSCGEEQSQRRGFSPSRTGRKQRFQCGACGHWFHGKTETVKGVLR